MPGDADRPGADGDQASWPGDAGEAGDVGDGDATPVKPSRGRLVVLTGPSGVGKSTVLRALRTAHPELWISVSVTTRTPRPGEIDGREYHFVTQEEFDYLVGANGLLEWARFAGNGYGTPRAPVLERLEAGIPVLLEIDLQGARQVRKSMPEAVQVFLAPPSWDELERRLVGRGTEPPDVIDRRLAAARVELNAESEFDHSIDNHDVGLVCTQLLDLLGLHS